MTTKKGTKEEYPESDDEGLNVNTLRSIQQKMSLKVKYQVQLQALP